MFNTSNKLTFSKLKEKYSMLFVLIIMFIVCIFLNPNFLSVNNLTNVARQLAVGTILAYGATLLIISGMLDLSAGSVLALSGVMAVSFFRATESLALSMLVGISVGVACNLVNAFMIATCKIPPFIATLAMQAIARGIALLYTQGQNILQIGRFTVFGQGEILGLPTPIIFLIFATIVIWYLLNHTRFGRSLYAIGGNQEAAVAAGINVTREKYKAFIVNGILVGLAGVLFMSRVNAGLPNGAIGAEMDGLTAAIVGGTSFSGGVGTTGGTLIGAFIIGFLNNIMNLTGVDSYVQQITKGAIIALAVIYDIRSKNKKTRKVILVDSNIDSDKTPKKT